MSFLEGFIGCRNLSCPGHGAVSGRKTTKNARANTYSYMVRPGGRLKLNHAPLRLIPHVRQLHDILFIRPWCIRWRPLDTKKVYNDQTAVVNLKPKAGFARNPIEQRSR